MKSAWRSGVLYFVLLLLLVEGITRFYIVERAFLSPYGELARINDNLARLEGLPRVVFLGSSQTQAAIATREMTTHLDILPHLLVNASAAAGGPREMYYLFSRNLELFREVEIVYLNVDIWMFNRHTFVAEQYGGPAWRRNATLQDRLSFPADYRTRADWILGWIFGIWDQRDTWRSALLDWFRNPWTYNPDVIYDCFGRPVAGFLTAVRDITPALLIEEAEMLVASQMQHFELNREAFTDLERLVGAIREQGATPVFLRVPASGAYNNALRQARLDEMAIWQEFGEYFLDVARLDLSEIVLSELHYWWDPYHMSETGALVFALPLADDLRQRLSLQ